jgi:integrase
MKFTDRSIQALKPHEKRYIEWKDGGNGLGIRITPSGRKSFIFMYRFDGRPRMMTLGVYPKTTLADAHQDQANALKLLEKGIDPGERRVEANQEARKALTVKQLGDEYLEKWAKPRKRSWEEDKRILDKDVLPRWKHRRAKDITRRDVITLLDSIVDRGAPIAANKTLAVIRKMYNFAIGRDIVETTPCAAIPAPSKINQRDRVLSADEIKAFWNNLEEAEMSKEIRLALKLQLLTAQRRGEIATIAWNDVDSESGWWTIPAERSKNTLPHRVPLSSQATAILEELKALNPESSWVFPSPRGKKTPVTADSLTKALSRNFDKLKTEHFSPHDLRRTAASQMTAMGISRLVVSKILNHVESGITAVYDRHSYDKEKRQALDAWGRQLDTIIKGKDEESEDKVVELKRA